MNTLYQKKLLHKILKKSTVQIFPQKLDFHIRAYMKLSFLGTE